MDTTTQRRCCSASKQTALSSAVAPANDFLRWQFLPKYEPHKKSLFTDPATAKRGFLTSLSALAAHYNIAVQVPQVSHTDYFIALCIREAQRHIRKSRNHPYFSRLALMQGTDKHLFLAPYEYYDTEQCLYHLPLLPLYKLLQQPKTRKSGYLLLSVYSYLLTEVQLPFYQEDESFLFNIYDLLET